MFRYEKRDIQYFANESSTALDCGYHNKYKN